MTPVWMSEDHLKMSQLSFHRAISRDQTQVKLGSKYFYSLNHLDGPLPGFLFVGGLIFKSLAHPVFISVFAIR